MKELVRSLLAELTAAWTTRRQTRREEEPPVPEPELARDHTGEVPPNEPVPERETIPPIDPDEQERPITPVPPVR